MFYARSSMDESAGLRSRRLQVRVLPRVPIVLFLDSQVVRHRTVNAEIVRSIRTRGAIVDGEAAGMVLQHRSVKPVPRGKDCWFDSNLLHQSLSRPWVMG